MISEHITLYRVSWRAALRIGFGIVLANLIVGAVFFAAWVLVFGALIAGLSAR